MKECFSLLTPVLTNIVNSSLSTGVMPDVLTIAAVTPTLKKHNADFTKYESFRPISNLKFVSKLVEKAVCVQLTDMLHLMVFRKRFNPHTSHFTPLKRLY